VSVCLELEKSSGDVAGLGGVRARERRHDDATLERERAELDGSEESLLGLGCHDGLLLHNFQWVAARMA
jgi:hypothetical protein